MVMIEISKDFCIDNRINHRPQGVIRASIYQIQWSRMMKISYKIKKQLKKKQIRTFQISLVLEEIRQAARIKTRSTRKITRLLACKISSMAWKITTFNQVQMKATVKTNNSYRLLLLMTNKLINSKILKRIISDLQVNSTSLTRKTLSKLDF